MKQRTDIHSPKNLDPANYEFEDVIYLYPTTAEIWTEFDRQHYDFCMEQVKADGFKGGNFDTKRTCDHCGASFRYGMLYRHVSGEIVVVGNICADQTFSVSSKAALELKKLKKRVSTFRGKIKSEAARAKRWEDLEELYPDVAAIFEVFDHYIIQDIKQRYLDWGKISDKQLALVRKIAQDIEEKANTPEPEWQEVTEGKRDVTGTILTVKFQNSMYGTSQKMLVHLDGDQKVWGTCPEALSWKTNEYGQAEARDFKEMRGMRISFRATFERSKDDAKFGFFKRPTKVVVVEEPAAKAA